MLGTGNPTSGVGALRHRRTTNSERGATALVVAIALLLMMGFTSLAIDASLGFDDRRGTQNAADLAALGAAWQHCNPSSGGGSPQTVARQTADDNGYAHDPSNHQVVTVHPGSGVPADGKWRVEIATRNEASFGAATPYAPDELDILSEATARCIEVPYLGGYALFSKSHCTTIQPEMNGTASTITINGAAHTNGDILLSPGASASGEVTYRNTENTHGVATGRYFGSPVEYPLPSDPASTNPYPVIIAAYQPGGVRAVAAGSEYYDFGNTTITGAVLQSGGYATPIPAPVNGTRLTKSGIYYSSKSINLAKFEMAPGVRATFVSDGQIKIGSNSDFRGYDYVSGTSGPTIALFSSAGTQKCNPTTNAIEVSSNGFTWEGILYAPNGEVRISTSSATTLNGSIIGWVVNLSSANLTVNFDDHPTESPSFRVELVD